MWRFFYRVHICNIIDNLMIIKLEIKSENSTLAC